MNIVTLRNLDGVVKKFKLFSCKPKEGDLIVPIYQPAKSEAFIKTKYRNLSYDKVYKVYRVVNTNQVLVFDDINELVHITQSHYNVVEEISDSEYKTLKDNYILLEQLNKLLRQKNSNEVI